MLSPFRFGVLVLGEPRSLSCDEKTRRVYERTGGAEVSPVSLLTMIYMTFRDPVSGGPATFARVTCDADKAPPSTAPSYREELKWPPQSEGLLTRGA